MISLDEAIQAELQKSSGQSRFAVFDFDNTCIINDIGEALLAYICEHLLLRNDKLLENHSPVKNREEYHKQVFHKYYNFLKKGDLRQAYKFAARIFVGFTLDEISTLTLEAIKKEGRKLGTKSVFNIKVAKGLVARDSVVNLMQDLSSQGIKIYVITSSLEIAVKAALKYFGLSIKCIGIKLKKKNGILEDKFIEPLPLIKGKVLTIKKYIHENIRPLLGAGDNINDLSMLEYCRIKVIVNRNNELSKEAVRRNWYILNN